MAIIPPYLKKGDTIGIVCPAGYMPLEKIETCIQTLQQWGYKVKTGHTLGNQFNYFSGTDEERLNDLQEMINNDDVKAILCARGGYGTVRIIDRISFKKLRKTPKWIIGYSDITVLHMHVYKKTGIASLHSPMAAAFNDKEHTNEYVLSLKKALSGKKAKYVCESHLYNHTGSATAELAGGNLSILAHLIGTPSDVDTKGKILFIEDIAEYIYNVDRLLHQLKRSGKLQNLAALIVGSFTDMKETSIPYGKDVYSVIHEMVQQYDYPVCFNFPAGHQKENYALKIGVEYNLKVGKSKVQLREV